MDAPLTTRYGAELRRLLSCLLALSRMTCRDRAPISRSQVSFENALIYGIAAAAVAAVAESIPSSINDNIRVGVAAMSMLILLHWIIL